MSWGQQPYQGGGYGGAPPAGYAGGYGGHRPAAPNVPYGGAPASYGGPGGYAPPGPNAPPAWGAPPPNAAPAYAPTYGTPAGPPPDVSPELWHWFQSVDADRSGRITSAELQQALMNGNWTPFNAETCRLMIGMFDRDNGTIDIHEFAVLWKYIQDWKACFDRFDTDRSGNISAQELRTALHTFGYNLSDQFCALCVRVFDRRHTRSMDFDSFIQCCVMLKALTDQFRSKDTNQSGNIRIHYEEFLRMVLDNSMGL